MTSDEYVYIMLEFTGLGFNTPISLNSTMWNYINDLSTSNWPASLKSLDPATTIENGVLPIWIDQVGPIDGMDTIVRIHLKP